MSPLVDEDKSTETKISKKRGPYPVRMTNSLLHDPNTLPHVKGGRKPGMSKGISHVHNDSVILPDDHPGAILDDVVRKLLPQDQADDYIKKYPGRSFRFYLYENLAVEYTWRHIAPCIQKKYRSPSNCDWGLTICTETNSTDGFYSKRRFNRNGDVVVSKILDEYNGPLRTRDPKKGGLIYCAVSQCWQL